MIRWNIAICDDEKVALELLGSSLRGALRTRNVDASIETFSRPRELLSGCRPLLLICSFWISKCPA